MKRFLFVLCAVFTLAALPAHAGLPVNEADYLKAEEARFNAADKNHDGLLQKEETAAAFMGGELQISPATRDACMKSGRAMAASFAPPSGPVNDPNFKPLAKKDFLAARQGMFAHADANHDHTVTVEEATAMDQQMAKMCAAAPAMMDQARAFQNMGVNGTPSHEQIRAVIEKMQAIQPQTPKGAPMPSPEGGE
ncbi:MAG: hypothetical protein HY053_08110 [Proteobacteria bacterium]|nr:hypothetical protein [Pseudomonadota bacterium]